MADVEQARRRRRLALGVAAPIVAVAIVALLSPRGRREPPPPPPPTATAAPAAAADELPIVSKSMVASDPRSGAILLVGCCDPGPGSAEPASTWEWSGGRWTHLHPETAPPFRPGAAFAFDAVTATFVLQGGDGFSDTWSWDGRSWAQLRPATSPPAGPAVMTYYSAARVMVLLTAAPGADVAAWSWDGRTWAPLAAPPLPAGPYALSDDPVGGRVVLVAGGGCPTGGRSQAWTFDARTWTPAPGPPCDPSTQLGWDPASRSVIAILLGDTANVIGFGAEPATTWRWSGAAWSRVTTATAPEETGRLVTGAAQRPVFVSDRRTAGQPDLWVWAGAAWTPHPAGRGVGLARPVAPPSWASSNPASMEGET